MNNQISVNIGTAKSEELKKLHSNGNLDPEVLFETIIESREYEHLEQALMHLVRHAFFAGCGISNQQPQLQEAAL